jgi:hypothetical protein
VQVSLDGLGTIPQKKKAVDAGWAPNSDDEDDEPVPDLAD